MQIIKFIVLSHLDVRSAVWSNAPKLQLKNIQLTQNRAARLALPCSIRHSELLWMRVTERLAWKLILFWKTYLYIHEASMEQSPIRVDFRGGKNCQTGNDCSPQESLTCIQKHPQKQISQRLNIWFPQLESNCKSWFLLVLMCNMRINAETCRVL